MPFITNRKRYGVHVATRIGREVVSYLYLRKTSWHFIEVAMMSFTDEHTRGRSVLEYKAGWPCMAQKHPLSYKT